MTTAPADAIAPFAPTPPARIGLSANAEQRFLDIVCAVIGTIMAYRGVIDFFLYRDNPWRTVLGLIFFGGVVSIYLMHRRRKVGFWLFVLFDFSVGLVFIFALQDIWYHHVWPHIAYAAVFVPFYRNLHWGSRSPNQEVLVPPEPTSSFWARLFGRMIELVDRLPWIAALIARIAPLQRWINRRIINSVTSAPPQRPLPFSLWTPDEKAVPRDNMGGNTQGTFVSWPSLTDRGFTGRHLPPMNEAAMAGLPSLKALEAVFTRDSFHPSGKTTVLFCFFAQWFTDSFLRTHPGDARRNTSNHEIDLCQIYGLGQESTRQLRAGTGGRLCCRELEPLVPGEKGPVYPDTLADPETLEVKPGFARIAFDPVSATSFEDSDPPHGTARDLRGLLTKGIGDWAAADERWRGYYAAGLERANSTIVYAALNTIFLREHNRLAAELAARNSEWSDDQLFETARNINIVQLLKIIIEDYINHLAGAPFKLRLEQGFADRCRWYRTNRIALEFNLLYRWHAMVPDEFQLDGRRLENQEFRFNNLLLEKHGVEAVIHAAATQAAGRLVLQNSPAFLQSIETKAVAFARQFRIAPFNAYRRRWQLPSYSSISELTGGDERLTVMLSALYPDQGGVSGIERVELPVGLLAEQRKSHQVLPPLLRQMVASDAFSQALTSPLLAAHVYGADCFTEYGIGQIEAVESFATIVERNVTPGCAVPCAAFTAPENPENFPA